MRATHDDLEDPLLRPSAFSLVPRTLAAAGFSSTTVSMEILSNQTSHLIEPVRDTTSKVPTSSNACADSDAIQKENKEKEVITNKELKPRLRAQFRPMPDITKNADVATVDYSILKHIKDHVEFFKTAEDLENAEKELRRLRGEPSPENPPPRPRRTGLTRNSKSYTFNIDTTILKNALAASRNAPKDSNSTNKGLNAIPLEVSNPKEDTSIIDSLLSNMKNAAEGEEEALIWQSLNLKPTDISRLSTSKLPRFIINNNPIISTNKGCITPETSYEKTMSRSPLEALLDLQRKIMQRNPSFVPPIDDDSIIGSPVASTSGVCVSSKDNFKSKEKHSNELTNEIASPGKFASIVDQLSFQDKENITPDAAKNTVEGIASQNQVPEVLQGEVDKDVSSGYENAQNTSSPLSPLQANKTDNRLGNDTLNAVDHEYCLDHEVSPHNINVRDGDYTGMGADDDDHASLLENLADATDKALEMPQDVASSKEVSKDHQSSQSKASSIDVSLENALDSQEQEKLVPEESAGKKGKKRGKPAKQNKGKSKAKPKSRSDDQVDVPLQNPPESSNINIQVAPEESQVRKGKKRVAVRQGSLDMQRPEMPPQATESEVQVEDSHMESPREKKKQKASPKKQNKRESNKSLADGGLGVRRSTRVKSRPLQHWLGERFIYGRVDDSLATVIGVQAYSPTSKGPVMKVKSFVSGKYTALLEKQVGK